MNRNALSQSEFDRGVPGTPDEPPGPPGPGVGILIDHEVLGGPLSPRIMVVLLATERAGIETPDPRHPRPQRGPGRPAPHRLPPTAWATAGRAILAGMLDREASR